MSMMRSDVEIAREIPRGDGLVPRRYSGAAILPLRMPACQHALTGGPRGPGADGEREHSFAAGVTANERACLDVFLDGMCPANAPVALASPPVASGIKTRLEL